ncbi:ECs1072 family phage-associated protein [Enterobacter ludwigii]|uniref:ECs1072 family phage-associated protein n=1 Tax=Enterobacter ludwigii TaxID=299767 RepID=UPI003BEEBEDE
MDTNTLKSLLRSHALHVAEVKGWASEGEGQPFYRAWLHAELLLRLDMLIIEHRKAFATDWQPLPGEEALNHLLFVRTGWTPNQIKSLSFDDILLVLHEALKALHIPPEVLDLPEQVKGGRAYELHRSEPYRIELPPCSKKEWDPTLSEKAQGLRKPF